MIYRTAVTSIAVLIFMQSAYTYTGAPLPGHPTKISFSALNWKIPLGTPYRQTLTNGLRLYIAEDRSLPLVSISGYIKTGAILDPVGKEGIGSLTASLLRTGGTADCKADSLDALIEQLALSISFSLSQTQLNFEVSCLSQYADTALWILSQMLFHPTFEKAKVEQARQILEQNIRHRFDNPEPILRIAYQKTMFPAEANSRIATEASVKAITRDNIAAHWKSIGVTGNILMSIAGDFNKEAMIARLEALFPKSTAAAVPEFPNVQTKPATKCLIVHKQTTQAYVRLGLPLFMRPHPDYYAVSLLNMVLGGVGFTSRLVSKIRSDEGLTYDIDSEAESVYFIPGTWHISFFTKHASLDRALALIDAEVKKIRQDGITDEELSTTKKVLIDALPSSFRSPDDIVSTYAWSEYYGREPDLYVKYPQAINALTKEDIARVAQKYLDPDSFTYVVVGDTAAMFAPESTGVSRLKSLAPQKIIVPESLPALFDNKR
jgi:zinc protease